MKIIKELTINETGCIPPYWKSDYDKLSTLEECRSPEDLQIANGLIENRTKMLESTVGPCIEMFNSVVWNWEEDKTASTRKASIIRFFYPEKSFQQIEYLPDFDLETFISNVGGFVGIFLGYSLMQFPDLLGKFHSIHKALIAT